MSCTRPLLGYRAITPNPNGKRNIVFNPREGYHDMPVQIPCGQCIGCRLERARQWAMRCMLESHLWDSNIFLTLTYSDDYLPPNFSLRKKDLQLFFKRLRKEYGAGIRYFAAGEYGDKSQRPHYHAIIFNFKPNDGFNIHFSGRPLYISPDISRLWRFGNHSYGDVSFESASYVARYCLKKLTGNEAVNYGVREPEFAVMSRKPGIAREWFNLYSNDVYPADTVVLRDGMYLTPPKYFDALYEAKNGDIESIKKRRKEKAYDNFIKEMDTLEDEFLPNYGKTSFENGLSSITLWDKHRYKEEFQRVTLKKKETDL